jgi:class 3 adenylate cyclase
MAFFGFHGEDDDAARYAINAVNAALELKESFERIRIVWLDIWKIKLKTTISPSALKCGMNTGYSIDGSIPTEEREEFTTIGSSVNLASRLEGRATGNQIIVSSHTRERIQN